MKDDKHSYSCSYGPFRINSKPNSHDLWLWDEAGTLAEGSTQDKMKTRSAPADQRGFLCDFSFAIMNKSKAKSPLCDERDNMCGKSGTVHL